MNPLPTEAHKPLFGRTIAINALVSRAAFPGVTAIVGRPLVGKTSLVLEVAERLRSTDEYVIGYYEARGNVASHLRYAFMDLYTCWLTNASMREQARSLWDRHKSDLMPTVGRMFGRLLESLAGTVPIGAAIGKLVRQSFDGLADASSDLLTGGVPRAELPYEEARALAQLVRDSSGKRIALILDAWRPSLPTASDDDIIDSFLRHLDDWPNVHIIVAVNPSTLTGTGSKTSEHSFIRQLKSRHPFTFEVHELSDLDLSLESDRSSLCAHVRREIPAASQLSDDAILQLVGGFAGVLFFWSQTNRRINLTVPSELQRLAEDAQVVRYSELPQLFAKLRDAQLHCAAAIVSLPQLDASKWNALRQLLAAKFDAGDSTLDDLTACGLLDSNSLAPTLGHQTRHLAARRWFLEERRALLTKTSEALVAQIASQMGGIFASDLTYLEIIDSISELLTQLPECPAEARFLSQYAGALLDSGFATYLLSEDLLLASARTIDKYPHARVLVCTALNSVGILHVKLGKFRDALRVFSKCVEVAPPAGECRATSLVHRGICRGFTGDMEGQFEDLQLALQVSGASSTIRARAFYSRAIAKADSGEKMSALRDYTQVIDMRDAPSTLVAESLCNRGSIQRDLSNFPAALADYSAALSIPIPGAHAAVKSLSNRAMANAMIGKYEDAISDYTSAIDFAGASAADVAHDLIGRGVVRQILGELALASLDYEAVMAVRGAPAAERAQARNNLGDILQAQGQSEKAIAEYTAALESRDQNPDRYYLIRKNGWARKSGSRRAESQTADECDVIDHELAHQRTRAYCTRGLLRHALGDVFGAKEDLIAAKNVPHGSLKYAARAQIQLAIWRLSERNDATVMNEISHAIESRSAFAEDLVEARLQRAWAMMQRGEMIAAESDCSAVLEEKEASTAVRARAFVYRGVIRAETGDCDGALDDFDAATKIHNCPTETLLLSLKLRGATKDKFGDLEGALADYSLIVAYPSLAEAILAEALLQRGLLFARRDRFDAAVTDYTAAGGLEGADVNIKATALLQRGIAYQSLGNLDDARRDYLFVSQMDGANGEIRSEAEQRLKATCA